MTYGLYKSVYAVIHTGELRTLLYFYLDIPTTRVKYPYRIPPTEFTPYIISTTSQDFLSNLCNQLLRYKGISFVDLYVRFSDDPVFFCVNDYYAESTQRISRYTFDNNHLTHKDGLTIRDILSIKSNSISSIRKYTVVYNPDNIPKWKRYVAGITCALCCC